MACTPPKEQTVVGSWWFVESTTTEGKKRTTPKEVKKTIEIEFTLKGELKKRINGTLQQAIPYSYKNGKLKVNDEPVTHKFKGDTLFLYPQESFGFIEKYVRKEKKLK